jgi:hypothetical protein
LSGRIAASTLPVRLLAAIGGAVSGSVAWALLALLDRLDSDFDLTPRGHGGLPILTSLSTIPGLVFGALFGMALLGFRGLGVGRFLGYVLASGLGYLVAFHAAFFSVLALGENSHSDPGVLAWGAGGLLGGLAGSLVLGLASKFLLRVSVAQTLGMPVLAGTIAGLLLPLMSLDSEGHGVPRSLLVFFALWQGAYGATLAPLFRAPSPSRGSS